MERLRAEMVAETRVRIVSGLKRYFHGKRHEGLLSSRGLRMLDQACDEDMEEPLEPFNIFDNIQKVRAVCLCTLRACVHAVRDVPRVCVCAVRCVPRVRASGVRCVAS